MVASQPVFRERVHSGIPETGLRDLPLKDRQPHWTQSGTIPDALLRAQPHLPDRPHPLEPTKFDMNATPHGPVEPDIGHLKSFPDPPRNPDEWTWFRVLALSGVSYFLSWHFGTPETTVMNGKVYIAPHSLSEIKGLRAPDMLIAFNADPDACARRMPTSSPSRASRPTS